MSVTYIDPFRYGLGAQTFTASGTFIVPNGVTEISAVCIGGGASGKRTDADADGGRGGDLRYSSSISVTPGESLTITVGTGGAAPSTDNTYNAGSATSIVRASDSTVLLRAAGGTTQTGSTGDSSTIAGNIGGGSGGNGGASTATNAGGGGGAGGYSGNGGQGVDGGAAHSSINDGSGGAAAGGEDSTGLANPGGGVGIWGEGFSGDEAAAGGSKGGTFVLSATNGIGASAVTRFGSGGGGNDAGTGSARAGVDGAVRIVWNGGASYPSTNLVKTPQLVGAVSGSGSVSSIDISSIGATVGDIVILAIGQNLGDPPATFSTLTNQTLSGDGDLYLGYRVATTQAQANSITVSVSAGRCYVAMAFRYVYANSTAARNIIQGGWQNWTDVTDTVTFLAVPSREIGVVDSVVLQVVSLDGNKTSSISTPSPYTEIAELQASNGAGIDNTLLVAYHIAPNTNALSTGTLSASANGPGMSAYIVLPPGEYTTT